MYRYYSIKRPLGKNTITLDVKKLNIHSFKDPVYCEEIKKKAWGYIDFEKPIEDSQARKYGLVPVDLSQRIPKTWYCVTTRSRRRHFESSITKTIESIDKPDSKTTQGNKETIYEDWFDSNRSA